MTTYDYKCPNCEYVEECNVRYEDRLDIKLACPKCDDILKYQIPCPSMCIESIPDHVASGRFDSVRATRTLEKAKRKAQKKRDKAELKRIAKERSKI